MRGRATPRIDATDCHEVHHAVLENLREVHRDSEMGVHLASVVIDVVDAIVSLE